MVKLNTYIFSSNKKIMQEPNGSSNWCTQGHSRAHNILRFLNAKLVHPDRPIDDWDNMADTRDQSDTQEEVPFIAEFEYHNSYCFSQNSNDDQVLSVYRIDQGDKQHGPEILPMAYIALKQPYSRSIIPSWALMVLAPGDMIPEDIVMFIRMKHIVIQMAQRTRLYKRGRSQVCP